MKTKEIAIKELEENTAFFFHEEIGSAQHNGTNYEISRTLVGSLIIKANDKRWFIDVSDVVEAALLAIDPEEQA